jgi:Mn-dependent DtxR family transcriptional regulator
MNDPMKANTAVLVSRPNPAFDLTRVEDYLEVVYELIQKKGYARSADIAERLNVRSSSVTLMLQKLHVKGFIVYERYRGLTLTSRGERLARSIQQRHLMILKFLRIMRVEEKIAKSDAEGLEHHLHKATIDRIAHLVNYAAEHPSWFNTFEETLK